MKRQITNRQAKEYAEFLIKEHAYEIEGLSIHERAGDYFDDYELDLTNDDFSTIRNYIRRSTVTVEFDDQ